MILEIPMLGGSDPDARETGTILHQKDRVEYTFDLPTDAGMINEEVIIQRIEASIWTPALSSSRATCIRCPTLRHSFQISPSTTLTPAAETEGHRWPDHRP
ncbi:hypothetical protein [Methanosphaerula palustris]|uniref:hypothetical protein n=1 Tax=Methanosphaerula palustris TaxID=475088 RepID=UPI000325ED8B|nr:hypothetical protein [Methanosphaerula palustris]